MKRKMSPAMKKAWVRFAILSLLALIFVFQDEAVNRSDGAAKFDGGTFFITIRFDQFLNDQIFILFVHCKFNLSHTGTSQ